MMDTIKTQVSKEIITTQPRQHRRLFQWTLRGLLLFCIVVAIGVAWYKYESIPARQRKVVRELQQDHWVVYSPEGRVGIILQDDNSSYKSGVVIYGLDNIIWDKLGDPDPPSIAVLRKYIRDLTELYSLKMYWIEDLQQADVAALAKLPKLRILVITGKAINDSILAPLADFRQLENLNLSYTAISDATLRAVGKIPTLQYLDLTKTKITDEGLQHLSNLKSLRSLTLTGTQITAAGLTPLQGCTSLLVLDLTGTHLSKDERDEFKKNCRDKGCHFAILPL